MSLGIRNIPTKLLRSASLVVFSIIALSGLLVYLIKHNGAKWLRLACLAIFFILALSSLPVHPARGGASAQGSGLKRQLPPFYKLPDINGMITEGKKAKHTDTPLPPLKPATTCGYRDQPCKRKKEKEKKVGLNFAPSNDNAERATEVARKSNGSWLGRLGGAISNALSGFTSAPAKGNSFLASELNRNGGNSALAAFNNTAAGAATALQPPTFTSLTQAMLDPRYRIGGAGEDMFSGNYNFSLPLVSLPGRGGLDLNISLSYNSLLWVRYSNIMEFEPDYYQSLTAGFRTGFPEIDGMYTVNSSNTYIVHLPSGKRVEMRQSGYNNRFEAIDSSYLYLVVNTSNPMQMTLYATDGTQYKFEQPNVYSWTRCTQIKDSNGNYISIAYKTIGDPEYPATVIDKVTDTLGREIVFNYDDQPGGTLHLMSITQNRGGPTPYVWAQFDYSTKLVAPNFGSLTVYGPNNTNIPVLARVITAGRARHTFVYNSWGQVDGIGTYGEADNQRAVTSYAFPSTGSAQSDCPRFSQRNDGIFAWPGDPAYYDPVSGFGYAITYFYFDPSESFSQMNTPDAVAHKGFFHTSGNKRGLTMRTETHYGGAIQQFTDYTWLSDSAASPPLRPRVTEVKICDDRNHNGTYESGTDKLRTTAISYTTFASTIRLPEFVKEFNEGGAGVYRSTKTEYLAGAYISNVLGTNEARRIIGLPRFTYLYEGDAEFGPATLVAKTEYIYDSPDEAGTTFIQAHSSAPLQHDTPNFGTGFLFRGNVTKARRYSVVNGVAGSYIESKTGYYTTGNVALTKIARDAQTNIETEIYYDDSFSTGAPPPGQATYAYPTKVKDPDNFYLAVKYNYYFGGVTETIDPKNYAIHPTNPPVKTVRTYDSLGRLDKSAVWKDGVEYSHTRYNYSVDHNSTGEWTTVNNLAEETVVFHLLDGVSRERMWVSEHPGSQGGLKAYYQVFDKMGRLAEWSRPTEVNGGLGAAGDDSEYVFSTQEYDWKGRPKKLYHPTEVYQPPVGNPIQFRAKREIAYTGCGCAGADVMELTDEAGRKQKIYRDVFGRTEKTETLNWNGNVYSTQIQTYNVRDQGTQISQIAAAGGATQLFTRQYDGYGRLWKSRSPGQTADDVFSYFNDDRVQTIEDARHSTATYAYNNRGLVTAINYNASSGVSPSTNVSFSYDPAGNRTQMNDGVGYVNYAYDSLSRMESETRHFGSISSQDFTLSYDYNLAGQVKRITDPFGYSAYYNYDKTGRLSSLTGSPFPITNHLGQVISNQTDYLTEFQYRAWGTLKHYKYNAYNDLGTADLLYNTRSQVTRFDIQKQLFPSFGNAYQYHDLDSGGNPINDGRLRFVDDLHSDALDRSFTYDHEGRRLSANTGSQARDPNLAGFGDGPYKQSYQYDEFGNMNSRSGKYWWEANPNGYTATYTNGLAPTFVENGVTKNRTYDASGRILSEEVYPGVHWKEFKYDVTGKQVETRWQYNQSQNNRSVYSSYDGDGLLVAEPTGGAYTGHVRSTVLGGRTISTVVRLDSDPNFLRYTTNVWHGGKVIAKQERSKDYQGIVLTSANFLYSDPHNLLVGDEKMSNRQLAVDPLGITADAPDPNRNLNDYYNNFYREQARLMSSTQGTGRNESSYEIYGSGCSGILDGLPVNCNTIISEVARGLVEIKNVLSPTSIVQGGGWILRRIDGEKLGLKIGGETTVWDTPPNFELAFSNDGEPESLGGGQQATPCYPSWAQLVGPNNNDGIYAKVLGPTGITVKWDSLKINKEGKPGDFVFGATEGRSFADIEKALLADGWGTFYDPHWSHIGMDDYRKEYIGDFGIGPESVWIHFNMGQANKLKGYRGVRSRGDEWIVPETAKDKTLPPAGYSIHREEAKPGGAEHTAYTALSLLTLTYASTGEMNNAFLKPCGKPWIAASTPKNTIDFKR